MLKTVTNFLSTLFYNLSEDGRRDSRTRYIEEYLAESTDMCDFERRERELTRRGYL